jgi:hypothetical protein
MTARAADCGACKHWREGEENERPWLSEGILSRWLALGVALSQPFHTSADGHWFACLQAHHPRFYKPRDCGDFDYGWKRRCLDYEEKK